MRPLPLRKAASTASKPTVAAMPAPATSRARVAWRSGSAKTTIAAAISGAGMSASWSPPPSIVTLPPGTGQRRRSDLGGAVRTDLPAQPQAAIAPCATPRELGAAVRTQDELLFDLAAAGWAGPRGHTLDRRLEQHLLLNGKRSHLLHGVRRPHHEIDQGTEKRRHEAEQHREQRESRRRGAPASVANHVEGQSEPEHDQVRDDHDQRSGEQRPHVNQQ